MNAIKRLLSALFAFEATLAIAAYVVMAGLILLDVALRELFAVSIPGAQRVSVSFMILTGFLGLGLAAAKGRHLRPRFADGLVPRRWSGAAQRTGAWIMAAVFAVCAVYGAQFVVQAYTYGDMARSLDVPSWIMELIVPYAFASVALRYVLYAVWPALAPEEAAEL